MRLSIEEDNMTTFPRTSVEARHFDATLGMFVPNGYNAEQNCRWAEQHVVSVEHKIRALAAATPGIRSLMGLSVRMSGSLYFYMVGSGGEWDYKRTSSDLADAGNYNFGYTALCAGLTLVEAKAAGGIYQVLSGTSKLGWWDSLFDDPVDAAFIEKGYLDAQRHHKPGEFASSTISLLGLDRLEQMFSLGLRPENRCVAPRQDVVSPYTEFSSP
jgi:hypothetical protein